MVQILDNLMDNAIKQTVNNRRKITVVPEAHSTVVRIQIIDNGIGIDPADIDRIFKPFTSVETEYSAVGTGIGLYLSQILAQNHGGAITAYSEGKGHGATFILQLPRILTGID